MSLSSVVQLTMTIAASSGFEVVNRFATSFPVGVYPNGSVPLDEASMSAAGAFYTDNGLELIPRARVPR